MDQIFPSESQPTSPQIFPDQAASPAPEHSEEQNHVTAQLAALAINHNKDSNEPYATTVARVEEQMATGGESSVRQQIGVMQKASQVKDLQAQQAAILARPYSPESAGKLKDNIDQQLDVQMSEPNPNALEIEGIKSAQAMAWSDNKQASIATLHKPDDLDNMRNNVTKAAIFARKADELEQRYKNEGVVSKVVDMLSFPFQTWYAERQAFGSGGILPGTTIYRDVNHLWSLPMDQFSNELNNVVDRVDRNSGLLSTNAGVTMAVMHNLGLSGVALNAFNSDIWAAVDLASLPGGERALKIAGGTVGLLRAVGNPRGAAGTIVEQLVKDQRGLAPTTGGTVPVHAPATAIGELLPEVATTKLIGEATGLSGTLTRKLTELTQVIDTVTAKLRLRTERLTDEQAAAQYATTAKQLAGRLTHDHVLDVKDAKIVRVGDLQEVRDQAARDALNSTTEIGTNKVWESVPDDTSIGWREIARDDLQNVDEQGMVESVAFADKNGNLLTPEEEAFENEGGAVQKPEKIVVTKTEAQPKTYDVERMESEGGTVPAFKKEGLEVSEPQPKTYDIERMESEGGMNPRVAATQLRVFPPGRFEYGIDEPTGIRTVSALVGDPNGDGGYQTLEQAQLGITQRGWDPRDVNIVKVDNEFAIRVTQMVPETSVITPAMKAKDLPSTFHGFVFWKNANDMLHEMFAGPLVRQMHVASALEDRVAKPLQRNIQKLSRASKKSVEAVINLGYREENPASQSGLGKWYNPNEYAEKFAKVKGRAPTDDEVVAYYSFKELYDWDFNIRNDTVWTSKARQGWGTMSVAQNPESGFQLARTNARLVNRPRFDDITVYDVEQNRHIGAGTDTEDLQKRWQSGEYNLFQTETHFDIPNGDKGEYILSPKSGSTFGPLERKQLPYVVGGYHRQYRAKFFAKQAMSQMLSPEAGGKEVWLQPLTHRAFISKTAGEEWAANQESARLLYNRLIGNFKQQVVEKGGAVPRNEIHRLTTDELLTFQKSDAGSFEKFHDLVKQGKISKDHPFEVLYDRSMPSAMAQSDPNVARWFQNDMPEYERELITNGRMYYSPQGDHLLDETGKEAPVLSPFKTLDRALANAIKTKALWDYNTKVIEEWTRMAREAGILDENALGSDRSAQNAFVNGRLKITQRGTTDQADAFQALENMRRIHKRLLNYKTPDMAQADMAVRRFANWAEGKGGKFGDWAAAKAFDINDTRPLQAIRAFVYDTTIGMFNPVRLWLHSMTAVAAMTVHPIYGRAAGYMAPFLRLMDQNGSEALVDHFASYGKAITGFDPAEFKQMVQEYKRSGISTTGNDQIMLDSSGLMRWAGQLRDRGRIFMKMAEGYNRAVGWQIAWRKVVDEFPELERGSEEFINKVHVVADDMTNNQTIASRSGWQTGFASTVTQFMQYQARMLERMLPKVLGGSERATPGMKIRLAAGQAIMYGAAGIPLAGSLLAVARDQYQQATGKDLDPDTWREASKGLFDTLLYLNTGSDTDVADRAGIGAAWGHFFSDMANGRMESVLQFAGGPTGEILDSGYQTLNKIALYYRAQQVDTLGPEQFALIAMDLGKFMQTMTTAQKEYWMMKTGYLQDLKTGQPIVPATTQDEMLVALGIPLRVERERFDFLNDEESRADLARETGKTLSMFDRNAMAALQNGDDRGFTYWSNMAAGLMQVYRDDPRLQQEIVQQSYQLDKQIIPEWDQMMSRIQKNTGIQQEFK